MPLSHIPVLFNEAMQALAVKSEGIYLDATFGRGGHSRGILQQLGPVGRLIAIDRDESAQLEASAIDDPRFVFVRGSFSSMLEIAKDLGISGRVDGILMDIGVSSPQLDDASRGFSFDKDGPLDMRMDKRQQLSAQTVINEYSKEDLARIFKLYGEERYAAKVAAAIIRRRAETPFSSTLDLAKFIESVIPYTGEHKHKATRCFQAVRIEVNGELDELKQALHDSPSILKEGGRLCVITFHSLEDRIVKTYLKEASSCPKLPRSLPLRADDLEKLRLQTAVYDVLGGAVKASQDEIKANPRSRSATLRTARRLPWRTEHGSN